MKKIGVWVIVSLCFAGFAGAQQQRGAKELFYDPNGRDISSVSSVGAEVKTSSTTVRRTPAPPRTDERGRRLVSLPDLEVGPPPSGALGLSYWIELETPGDEVGKQVTESRTFLSGERIRLHFRSNSAGNISLLQLGASGTSEVLFPDVEKGLVDSTLEANQERILPSEGHWFRFDGHPGQERLIVLFARSQDEIDKLPISQRMDSSATQSFIRVASHLRGSKDLVIETEVQNATEIGTYGVNVAGQPVVLEIVLEHR